MFWWRERWNNGFYSFSKLDSFIALFCQKHLQFKKTHVLTFFPPKKKEKKKNSSSMNIRYHLIHNYTLFFVSLLFIWFVEWIGISGSKLKNEKREHMSTENRENSSIEHRRRLNICFFRFAFYTH